MCVLLRVAVCCGNELVLGPDSGLSSRLPGPANVLGLHSDGVGVARASLHDRRHGGLPLLASKHACTQLSQSACFLARCRHLDRCLACIWMTDDGEGPASRNFVFSAHGRA